MKIKKYTLSVLLISWITSIALYVWMPSAIAVHWNINGNMDIELGRFWGTFLVPTLLSVMFILYYLLPATAFYKKKVSQNTEASLAVHVSVLVTFLVCYFAQLMIIAVALGWQVPPIRIALYFLAILMLGIGAFGKISENNYLGIKNQWTRTNPTVRRKINNIFSIILFAIGAVLLLSLIVLHSYDEFLLKTFMGCLIVSGISLHFYSKYIFNKDNG